MRLTTKHLTTTAAALSLGLLLAGSPAMAADAPPATLSSAPLPAVIYPLWTPEERRQSFEQMLQRGREHWEQVQQSARELWVKWGPTPEQRQQYWGQIQQGWQDLKADLKAMVSPSAKTPPPAPAMAAAVAPTATPSAALAATATYPPMRVYNILALWRMTPEQRQQYWEYMQRGS